MQDALARTGRDMVYSYEPYCWHCPNSTDYLSWVPYVGDLWRTGGDIVPVFSKILGNAYHNNNWAHVMKPGHFNDADMLEIGNGQLTLAEQRSHFAIWCLMKSPLIIGADVRSLTAESLAILKNKALIGINQDPLAAQGTLRAAMGLNGERSVVASQVKLAGNDTIVTSPPWVSFCTGYDHASDSQHWEIKGDSLVQGSKCLSRAAGSAVEVEECDSSDKQRWNFGKVNVTVSQIRDSSDQSSCLAFNGTMLHMESCRVEPANCTYTRCHFSVLVDQLWYLSSLGQMTSTFTNFPDGAPPGAASPRNVPQNIPWCLATAAAPWPPAPPAPPVVDRTLPLQVWAGPLAGGDVAAVLLNIGNATSKITATWADIGLDAGVTVTVMDLWSGKSLGTAKDTIEASVGPHDNAALRLSPTK